MREFWSDILEFIRAVWKHWGTLATGATVSLVAQIAAANGVNLPSWVAWAILLLALVIAFFQGWKDQKSIAEAAQYDRDEIISGLNQKISELHQQIASLKKDLPVVILEFSAAIGGRWMSAADDHSLIVRTDKGIVYNVRIDSIKEPELEIIFTQLDVLGTKGDEILPLISRIDSSGNRTLDLEIDPSAEIRAADPNPTVQYLTFAIRYRTAMGGGIDCRTLWKVTVQPCGRLFRIVAITHVETVELVSSYTSPDDTSWLASERAPQRIVELKARSRTEKNRLAVQIDQFKFLGEQVYRKCFDNPNSTLNMTEQTLWANKVLRFFKDESIPALGRFKSARDSVGDLPVNYSVQNRFFLEQIRGRQNLLEQLMKDLAD